MSPSAQVVLSQWWTPPWIRDSTMDPATGDKNGAVCGMVGAAAAILDRAPAKLGHRSFREAKDTPNPPDGSG